MSELPERKYFGCRSCSQVGQTHCQHPDNCGQVTEYIRTDLVPAWHDKPTCEGVWLRDMDAYDIKLWCGTLSYHLFDEWYEAFGGWYGPIPEEPK